MAGFINFQNGQYNQDSFNKEFGAIVGATEKIVVGTDKSLKVSQTSPLANKVKVTSGEAFINSKFVYFDSTTELVVENNLSGSTRKDNVVIELTGENTAPVMKVIKGTATAPVVTSTQILLAEISVVNNSLSISDSNINDKRNLSPNAVSNAKKLDGHTISEFVLKEDYTRKVIFTDNDQRQMQVIEKWADGRMKITQTFMMLTPIAVPWGSMFTHLQNGSTPDPFVEKFKTIDYRTYGVKLGKSQGQFFGFYANGEPTISKMGHVLLCRPTASNTNVEYSVIFELEGTWK